MCADKSFLRKQKLILRKSISEEELQFISEMTAERIRSLPQYKNADTVYFYMAVRNEVSVSGLFEECRKAGRKCVFPRVISDFEMKFFLVYDMKQLKAGYMGIMEPDESCIEYNGASKSSLMLVPGAVFDRHGGRIGMGKGYYDRYISRHDIGCLVGVCGEYQIEDMVPTESYDVSMDYVVSEKAVYRRKEEDMEYTDIDLKGICEAAVNAKKTVGCLNTNEKNAALLSVADALVKNAAEIIKANEKDMDSGRKNGMKPALLDRLMLNDERINAMANGLRKVAGLPDPIGEVMDMSKRPNGMIVGKRRVPMGVVGIIYEARPNVTSDGFGLCFKSGNVCILKGGSDAINSTRAIVKVIRAALEDCGITADAVTLIDSVDRLVTHEFMRMNKYVDLLIPRGSASLIRATMENSTIPVIETGTGNCHIYVDKDADTDMAVSILINAKTQRIGVCNACESLVVHKDIIGEFLPKAAAALKEHNVEIRGDECAREICAEIIPASEEDFYTEYLDYIISVKTVSSIEEAIDHINEHNTKHSEAIITKNYDTANKFLDGIDAACVYVNASTRFTDGEEFGFGAEIGISTQKLHARGPMGLKELTTYKYVIYGSGQVRP